MQADAGCAGRCRLEMVRVLHVCITDVSVAGGKSNSRLLFTTPNAEDGAGRLLRLDSSVDMKLGDLGGMTSYVTVFGMLLVTSLLRVTSCFKFNLGSSRLLWQSSTD